MIVLDTLLIHGPVLILQSLQVATNMHPACPNKIVCKLLAPTDPIREKRRFLAVGTLRAAQDNEALLVTQVIKFWFSWINFSNTALLGVQKANVFARK